MPFRAAFDCLWCGRSWRTRAPDDLEGWAALCSDCLGRAGENPFLAFRLRSGLRDRAAAARSATPAFDAAIRDWSAATVADQDDRYLRAGRFGRGPVLDLAWQGELDTVTGWLDGLPLRGDIVELAAGTGWWSPLIAQKGELSLYDLLEEPLDRARRRLMAHGLRAHLHVRDAWAEPDRQVDAVVLGLWLSLVPDDRLPAFLGLVGRWLRPGGIVACIDRTADAEFDAVDEPAPVDGLARRRLPNGREVVIPQVARTPDELAAALRSAGFSDARAGGTPRFFTTASAVRP